MGWGGVGGLYVDLQGETVPRVKGKVSSDTLAETQRATPQTPLPLEESLLQGTFSVDSMRETRPKLNVATKQLRRRELNSESTRGKPKRKANRPRPLLTS